MCEADLESQVDSRVGGVGDAALGLIAGASNAAGSAVLDSPSGCHTSLFILFQPWLLPSLWGSCCPPFSGKLLAAWSLNIAGVRWPVSVIARVKPIQGEKGGPLWHHRESFSPHVLWCWGKVGE